MVVGLLPVEESWTPWCQNKLLDILQATFPSAFYWVKSVVCWFMVHKGPIDNRSALFHWLPEAMIAQFNPYTHHMTWICYWKYHKSSLLITRYKWYFKAIMINGKITTYVPTAEYLTSVSSARMKWVLWNRFNKSRSFPNSNIYL